MSKTLDSLKGKARVLITGFGVKLMKKPMHEKTSCWFNQELERTISHVSTSCAYTIIDTVCMYQRETTWWLFLVIELWL